MSAKENSGDTERDRIKQFYDEEYYTDSRDHDALPWHYRVIARRLGALKGQRMLDVACGTGKWAELAASMGAFVAGVDISELAVAACRARIPEGDFHLANAENLPFDDGSFDLITCLGSMEHFMDPSEALREMMRVAKPGCQFLLLVPNSGFLPRRLGVFIGTHQVKIREVVRSLPEWRALFMAGGLTVVHRWRDLHVVSLEWVRRDTLWKQPLRLLQALMLPIWPMGWQYQVYHLCRAVE